MATPNRPIEEHLAETIDSLNTSLVLQQFTKLQEKTSVITAIQNAVAKLQLEYRAKYGSRTSEYRVGGFCRLLGIKLIAGTLLRNPKTGNLLVGRHKYRGTLKEKGRLDFYATPPTIIIPDSFDRTQARITVAHEIGHYLVRQTADGIDTATEMPNPTEEEEAMAEYASRLLLMPGEVSPDINQLSLALTCINEAGLRQVSIWAAVARSADPDRKPLGVRGAILWKIKKANVEPDLVHEMLAPEWHLCPNAFVRIGKGGCRQGSLIAQLAGQGNTDALGTSEESVRIGGFVGNYKIDAFAWGSLKKGTRRVLSIFLE